MSGGGGAGAGTFDAGADAPVDAPDDVGPQPVEDIFVHTGQTLFKLDLESFAIAKVADFSGCSGSVIDIAASSDGTLFAASSGGLFRVQPSDGTCTSVASGSYPNSLCMVPKGVLDADSEVLVGFVGSVYVQIDRDNGAFTILGNLGSAELTSSGDMIALPAGGAAYLTVTGPGCADCLVEIDPKTGAIVNMVGPLGYEFVYGLASSQGRAFGFTSAGEAFRVDVTSGETTPIVIPNPPPGISFFGAASRPADLL